MVPLAAGTSWPGRWTCRWPGAGSKRGGRADGAGGSGGEPHAPSLQRSPLPVASGMVPPRVDQGLSEAFPDSPCVPITPSTPGAAVRCPGRQLTLPNPCPPACVPCPCSLHLFAMTNSLLRFTLCFSKTGLLTAAAVNPSGPRGDPAPRAVPPSTVPGSPSAGIVGDSASPSCCARSRLPGSRELRWGQAPSPSALSFLRCPDPQARRWQVPMSPPCSKGGRPASTIPLGTGPTPLPVPSPCGTLSQHPLPSTVTPRCPNPLPAAPVRAVV